LFREHGPRHYREGWVFDGQHVVLDEMLCQTYEPARDLLDGEILLPSVGSGRWFSPKCDETIYNVQVFDSKQEATAHAAQELADEIRRLTEIRDALLDSMVATQ